MYLLVWAALRPGWYEKMLLRGASAQAAILRLDGERWGERPRECREPLKGTWRIRWNWSSATLMPPTIDSANPTVTEVLERLLDNHADVFIEIIA